MNCRLIMVFENNLPIHNFKKSKKLPSLHDIVCRISDFLTLSCVLDKNCKNRGRRAFCTSRELNAFRVDRLRCFMQLDFFNDGRVHAPYQFFHLKKRKDFKKKKRILKDVQYFRQCVVFRSYIGDCETSTKKLKIMELSKFPRKQNCWRTSKKKET